VLCFLRRYVIWVSISSGLCAVLLVVASLIGTGALGPANRETSGISSNPATG
jgi:hypothetical protein